MRRFTYQCNFSGLNKHIIESEVQPNAPSDSTLVLVEDITEEFAARQAAAALYEAQYQAALERATTDASGALIVDMTPTPSLLDRAKAILGL